MTIKELLDRSLIASNQNKWDQALEYVLEAIDKSPKSVSAHQRLGLVYWGLNKKNLAINNMKKAIALEPELGGSHYSLAGFYALDNKKEEMLFHLKKAIACYSGFIEAAEEDEKFKPFFEDDDFIKIVNPHKKERSKLLKIVASNDYEAISKAILQIDKAMPMEAIDWKDSYDEDNVSNLLEGKYDTLSSDALLYLFKMVTLHNTIESFDSFLELAQALQSKIKEEFNEVLIETWKARYEDKEAGHLTSIDYRLLDLLEALPVEKSVEVVLWGFKSHGSDALQDYESLCALALQKLPEPHKLRTELVEVLDGFLHADLYLNEDFTTRQHRIKIALIPPPLEIPGDSNDYLDELKAGIVSFHPVQVVNAATQMALQERDSDIVKLAKQQLPRICEIVTDSSLPIDLRMDAVKVIEKIGDNTSAVLLNPSLSDTSVRLLEAIGKVMYAFNVTPKEAKIAVNYVLEIKEGLTLYNKVCTLSWFKDEQVIDFLLDTLNNPMEGIRREAINGLGLQKASRAIPQIVTQLLEGSSQCVAAAAEALDRIGGTAIQALEDLNHYEKVLHKAKENPLWASKALNFFRVAQANNDLITLLNTTGDYEAYDHLTKGIAHFAKEESMPKLIEIGLDPYKTGRIPARYFIRMFNAIARKNGNASDSQLIEEVKDILVKSPIEDVIALTKYLEKDAKYAPISKPTPHEKEALEKYTAAYLAVFKSASPEIQELIHVMFFNYYDKHLF